MCGINGFTWKSKQLIQLMNKVISHRGPDKGKHLTDNNISLGHRRLAVLDLSPKGDQPMKYTHKKRTLIMTYNGEIYNFKDLREILKKKGYQFRSESDSEVILASYIEWGKQCVEKFNGMWALCIYDKEKKELFISRDRLGQKPLYYSNEKNQLIFSSELKAILCHQKEQTLNKEGIDLYLSLGFIPAPYTVYKQIHKLEAGHNLTYNLATKKLEKTNYFKKPTYKPLQDKEKLIKKAQNIITNACEIRMIADVPLGAFLSGGIDSSTVVNEMTKRVDKKKLHTFSIGFDGSYDETPAIKTLAKQFKTNHHHEYFREKEFKTLQKKVFKYFDEPFADPSLYPTFYLSKFARPHLTVALSGDGGDELFGGYPRHQMAAQMKLLKKIPLTIRRILLALTKGKLHEGIRLSLLPFTQIFSHARPEIYKPKVYKELTEKKMSEALILSNGEISEAMLLYDRYFQTLPDNFLQKVDRASMAHGLEVRSPFLDYRLIELSSQIPTKWKFTMKKNKILLREIATKFLPPYIATQKKAGFTPPIERWLLQEEYTSKLQKIINELRQKNIISKEWKTFYIENVMKNKESIIHKQFIIRIYLLHYWAKYWGKI